MRKLCLGVLASSLAWFSFGAHAAAVEEGSLLYQTSFGLYYLEDPFDVTLNPALVHRVERWRLYTNLSNYEGASSYLVGTSGRLGPGSLGLFYEGDRTHLGEEEEHSVDWQGQSLDPKGVSRRERESESLRSLDERTQREFIATYGAAFGRVSVGVNYRPSHRRRRATLERGGSHGIGDGPDFWTDPFSWRAPSFVEDVTLGQNSSSQSSWDEHDLANPQVSEGEAWSDDFDGVVDVDEDTNRLEFGSELTFLEALPVWVRVGFADVRRRVDAAATFSRRSSAYSRSGTSEMADDVFETSRWEGEVLATPGLEPFDGQRWSFEVVPRYRAGDVVTFELGLGYERQDGDVTGRWTQDVAVSRTSRTPGEGWRDPGSWQGGQRVERSFAGEGEGEALSVAPRVYLSYPRLAFALGVGYERREDAVSGTLGGTSTRFWSYDNDDGRKDASDWRFDGASTEEGTRRSDRVTKRWSFPVAATFQVTEKLSLRAGAEYTRTANETATATSTAERERYTLVDGAGTPLSQGDLRSGRTGDAASQRTTSSATAYRLGAGYQAADNLELGLMFSQAKVEGGVDTTTVFASAVFGF